MLKINTQNNLLNNDSTKSDLDFIVLKPTGIDDTDNLNTYLEKFKRVQLLNATYNIGQIIVPEGSQLIGAGSTKLCCNKDLNQLPLLHVKGSNIIIQDLNIEDCNFRNKGITIGDYGNYTGSGKLENITLSNIVIKNILSRNPAIQVGYCKRILIKDCYLKNLNKATDNDMYSYGICLHSQGENIIEEMFIINNLIDGFYHGVTSFGTGLRKNLFIDGNTILNSCSYAIDGYHALRSRISNNKIEKCTTGIYFDSGALINDDGLGNICANNQITSCKKYGIKTEELMNGVIIGNTIQKCMWGILFGGGSRFSSLTSNTITKCEQGIVTTNNDSPQLIQPYYNTCNNIESNFISECSKNAINLMGVLGVWNVKGNNIICNNTSNGDYYAIFIDKDIVGSISRNPQRIIISNNSMHNFSNMSSIIGYQKGVKVNTSAYSHVYFMNNYFNNYSVDFDLYYGKSDFVGNIVDSNNKQKINYTKIRQAGNIGIFEN